MSLSLIIDKMSSRDKDFRYMATSDLLGELQKESFKMDFEVERKLCLMVLKLLSDAAGDVQGLAVKCVPLLVRKVQTSHVEEMVDRLFQMVKGGKEDERDISSIALKTVLAEVPQSAAGTAVRGLTPRLLEGIAAGPMEVTICCLEILHDVLTHFPALVHADLPTIKAQLLPELSSPRAAVRKRSVACVGAMCGSLPDPLFEELVAHILAQVESGAASKGADAVLVSHIQTLSAVARAAGFRLGRHLERVVPLVLRCAELATAADEAGTEVAEHCLQACEALVARCPGEVTPFVPALLKLGLQYVKHDPNYADDEEDGGDDAMDEDADADEDEEDFGDEYSDDDDTSWKVRRAAAKLLASIVSAKPDAVPGIFGDLCPALLARFGEREESVKGDVFATTRLLVQCAAGPAAGPQLRPLLAAELPRMVTALRRQLAQRSGKTRSGAFLLLRELATTLPGGLADHVAVLLPAVDRALRDKAATSALRMEVLVFLRQVIDSHPPEVLHPHLALVAPPVVACVGDRYYKVTAEALRTCASVVRALRPSPPAPSPLDMQAFVPAIYEAVARRLAALDQDQEVKEASIATMGTLVSQAGDALGGRVEEALPVLLDRLRNEITRLTAVRAFESILSSPLGLPLDATVPPLLSELCSYLRKTSRSLRQASLLALRALATSHARALGPAQAREVLAEVAPIVSDRDMQLAAAALGLCRTVVDADPATAGPLVAELVLGPVLELVASPLLQGVALVRVQELLARLVSTGAAGVSFGGLLDALLAVGRRADGATSGGKQTLTSVAACVAALAAGAPEADRVATIERFMAQIQAPGDGAAGDQLLSLYCLGQIGRRVDLSAQRTALMAGLAACLEAPAEELRAAAAFALGCVAAGSVDTYLPLIVAQVADPSQSGHHYLLLQALKELIVSARPAALAAHVSTMLPLLYKQAEGAAEEGVRAVVSECLGKLLAAAPAAVLPALHARLADEAAEMRAIAVASLRFAIVDHDSPLDAHLPAACPAFLGKLADPALRVRHAALLALSCVAHNRPGYLADCLPALLGPLYGETEKKKDLVHEVDLGPFKHKVDDGLELRKAAFECMDTLLDACADRLDLQPFIARLIAGLTDDYDIKMLCHLVLCKMATRPAMAPALLGMLETAAEPLRKTVAATLKENAVKQEAERHEELVRSGLRVACLLSRIPGAESSIKWDEFVRVHLKQGKLAGRYAAIQAEVDGADEAADAMLVG